MPSFSRIKKLSVLAVAVAALGATSSASAATNDVWLWACHGPGGEALGDAFGGGNDLSPYGGGCDETGTSLDSGGLRGEFPAGTVALRDNASLNLAAPPGTLLEKVQLQRRVTGMSSDFSYSSKADGVTIDAPTSSDVAAGEPVVGIPSPTSGGSVSLLLECTVNPCHAANPVRLDVGRIGLKVTDKSAPRAAVGGVTSPARGSLNLNIEASDDGTGLRSATAYIDGVWINSRDFGGSGCGDLTPADGSVVDMALGADCPHVTDSPLSLEVPTSSAEEDKVHELNVVIVDWAGNESSYKTPIEVDNIFDLGTNVQQLNIGTTGTTTPNPTTNATTPGSGGVAGATAQSCRSPRLSFSLAQKPMRISKGVPILQSGKRYRFTGRLTCVIAGKRKAAPKRARIDILNKVGKKSLEKAGTTVRDKGRLTVILAYRSSRTITFRFTSSEGQRSQVNIRVKVEKKKKSTRR